MISDSYLEVRLGQFASGDTDRQGQVKEAEKQFRTAC